MSQDVLFQTPHTWAWTDISAICEIVSGSTPKSDNSQYFCDEGGIPWLTPADLSPNTSKRITRGRRNLTEKGFKSTSLRKLPPNSILYSSRAPIGHIAIADTEVTTNQGFKSLILPKGFDADFCYYYLKAITPYIQSRGSGTTFKEVSGSVMKTIPLVLPPLGEQKRIVAKIEATTQRIQEIEKAVESAETLLTKYRESLLAKAFRGELVPQNPNDEPASRLLERIRAERAKNQDGKKTKKDELPPVTEDEIPFEIPKSWEWVKMNHICKKITDGFHNTPKKLATGVPYISAVHVKDCHIAWDTCDFVSKNDHEELWSKTFPEKGDILVVNIGAGSGAAAIIDRTEPFSFKNVAILKLWHGFVDSEYALYWLLWVKKRNYEEITNGGCQPFLSLAILNNLLIPLPPVRVQKQIVETLRKHFEQSATTMKLLTELHNKKMQCEQAILSAAFSGRIVPQDPAEGTGHELLAVIKEQSLQIDGTFPSKKSASKSKRR